MNSGIFLDSSVIVALLMEEPGWQELARRMQATGHRYTSSVVLLESVMVLSSLTKTEPEAAKILVQDFLAEHDVQFLTIDAGTGVTAVEGFSHYGKGRHPARLNLGDCFSYACAKEHRLALLYKGDDFAQTDLA